MFKKLMALTMAAILFGMTVLPMSKSYAIDLKSLKTESKVITDLIGKTMKEVGILALKSRDVKLEPVTVGEKGSQYKGLQVTHAVDGDQFKILFSMNNHRRNLMTVYETATPTGGLLYGTYVSLTGTVLGKEFVAKQLPAALKASHEEKTKTVEVEAVTSASKTVVPNASEYPKAFLYEVAIKDKMDTVIQSGIRSYEDLYVETFSSTNLVDPSTKIKAGIGNAVIAVDKQIAAKRDYIKFINGLYTGLAKVLIDTKVDFVSDYNDQFEIKLTDKTSQKPIGGIRVFVKTGEVTVKAGADKGLDYFKTVSNVVLKQVDPSGKTTFDSAFKAQMGMLKEYQTFKEKTGLQETYAYINAKGQSIAVEEDKQFLSKMMPSFNLTSPLVQKEGVPALKVKIALFDGYLYVKDGSYCFLVDLY